MIINHNINAQNAHRMMIGNTTSSAKSMEKLSSGLRINRAGDDAAGLAISEKMRGQIRGLDQANRNSQDGISLIQTAEGALNETHSIIQRMRELAVQSATGTNTNDDRKKLQSEMDQLSKEVTRISNTTEFNTQNLLGGNLNTKFHVGANKGQNVDLGLTAMDAFSLGLTGKQVNKGAFAASATNITAISDLGNGLDAATYKVVIAETQAVGTTTAVGATITNGTLGAANSSLTSAGAGTLTGTYTGASDLNLRIKVGTISGGTGGASGTVASFQASYDGGVTWGSTVNGSSLTYEGVTWTSSATWNNSGTDSGAGAIVSYAEIKARVVTAQLQDNTGGTIGAAVTINTKQTTAVIGNEDDGKTMKLTFGQNNLVAGTATQAVTTVSSQRAVFNGDGTLSQDATALVGVDISSRSAANNAIQTINNALETVSSERSKMGAMQNRLEHTIANLGTSSENLTASESRIRDVDMAKEMMAFSKNNILTQAAQAMLAQANQQPQAVLQLLR